MMLARDNPFRMSCLETIPLALSAAELAVIWQRFRQQRNRGVLVGGHGSGKTTLRELMERQLTAAGQRVYSLVLKDTDRLSWDFLCRQLPDLDDHTVLSVDGIDRLSALLWWRLQRATQHCAGFLATSHVSGRLPVLHQHVTTPALLKQLVGTLTPDHHHFSDHACQTLFTRHCGNIRDCLRELYDTWPQQAAHVS
jgi:hypothetical protein